ncbi:MAG: FAD-dependent monooxygenase, partial [Deltaproteobacteria bacterium]|nr:FAD-dependent monooxygenase [Deltaproteobacteria bacterium]
MEVEYDVIIIGSGPAGSSAAKSLTQRGLETLILEKEKLPRYKCCSGVLFGEAQELI